MYQDLNDHVPIFERSYTKIFKCMYGRLITGYFCYLAHESMDFFFFLKLFCMM
ncbi:hypothetical protein IC582_010258 [Cucumis melo]